MSFSSQDWRPGCSIEMLHRRASLRQCIREFFFERNYLEVDTPLLSHDTVIDAHVDPIEVSVTGNRMFLQTSPEAPMKRLLAAGSESIFQITQAFRSAERGILHNPEFMIVEWYGVGDLWRDQMAIVEQLVRAGAEEIQGPLTARLEARAFSVTTYQQAFKRQLGIDVLSASDTELRKCSAEYLCISPLPDTRDDLLNLLLVSEIEPRLGFSEPEFLVDYPVSQAALAESSPVDPRIARRFELYVDGIELCNGYQELTDADELRLREATQQADRRRLKSSEFPGARRLLAAMDSGMPTCSGVAMGFDRLLMILTGHDLLSSVLPFSVEQA